MKEVGRKQEEGWKMEAGRAKQNCRNKIDKHTKQTDP